MSQAFFDPTLHVLVVALRPEEMTMEEEADGSGRVVLAIAGLNEGIEIVYDEDRLWRPA